MRNSDRSTQITDEEAVAMARAGMELFRRWTLTNEEAAVLLRVKVRTFRAWERGRFGRIGRETRERLSHLMGIHCELRMIFSEPERGYAWVRAANSAFGGQSALEVMLGGEREDLVRIRRYLETNGDRFDHLHGGCPFPGKCPERREANVGCAMRNGESGHGFGDGNEAYAVNDEDARLERVLAMANAVWGSDDEGRAFLERPHPLLDGCRPLDLVAESTEGAERVIAVLGRLRHGSAA